MPAPVADRRIGPYLAALQFAFALTWVVYVIYLPHLAAQVGLPRPAVAWLLLLDQLVFVVADFACGVAADRAGRVVGRVGRWAAAATLLSCLAFVALPLVAPLGSAGLLVALTVVWAATSSALRAPPLALVGRHAARPSRPALVAFFMLGLGLANAAAPYLAVALHAVDARVPFVLSSAALALVALGLAAAERRLASAGPRARPPVAPTAERASPGAGSLLAFGALALLGATAFQVHVFLNSPPLYQRLAGDVPIQHLVPVFWVGFNLALWPAGQAVKRWGATRVAFAAAALTALAALAAHWPTTLGALIVDQAIAGAAWGVLLTSAFCAAVGRSPAGRWSGLLASALAAAALARLAVVATGKLPSLADWLPVWPVLAWGLLTLLLARRALRPRGQHRAAGRSAG